MTKEFSDLNKELPYFILAFLYHHVLEDLKTAKKLYKEALRRSEFTKGCYQMMMSIYLNKYTYNKVLIDLATF